MSIPAESGTSPADARAAHLAGLVAQFLADTGRWPYRTSSDPQEAHLGNWLANARDTSRTGNMHATRKAILDEVIPGWQRGNRNRPSFQDNLAAMDRFMERHGREPRPESGTPEERRLAQWFSTWRARGRAGDAGDAGEEFARRFGPDWAAGRETGTGDEKFAQAAARVAAHLKSTGGFPVRSSTDPEVARMAVWVMNVRKFVRDGVLPDHRIRLLDEVIPGWRGGNRARTAGLHTGGRQPAHVHGAVFAAQAERLAGFVAFTGHLPHGTAADNDERALARWVSRLRRNARTGDLKPDRAAILDRAVPGWRDAGS